MDTIIIFLDPTSLHMNLYIQFLKTALKVGTLLETNISLALLLLGIVIYVSCAAPLSRSQRSLIRADTGRGVTQDFPKVARFVARRFKKKKSLKGSEKSLSWQHCSIPIRTSNRFISLNDALTEKPDESDLVIGDSIVRNMKIVTPVNQGRR